MRSYNFGIGIAVLFCNIFWQRNALGIVLANLFPACNSSNEPPFMHALENEAKYKLTVRENNNN